MLLVRRIGAALLTVAAIAVWVGLAPSSTTTNYTSAISDALAADKINNASAQGAPQQAVVNGWTARDLLTVIAQEGSASATDQRPSALLTLAVIGIALGLFTSRPRDRQAVAPVASTSAVQPVPASNLPGH